MDPAIHPFTFGDALRFGWTQTKQHLRPLLVIGAVSVFLTLLQRGLSLPGEGAALRSLLSLLVQIAQFAVALVYVRAALLIHDGRQLELGRIGPLLAGFFPFLLTSVLYALVVALGLVLLIVPGVIWGLKFAFAPYLVIDRNLDPVEAMRVSSRLTEGMKGPLFILALAVCGLNLLGAIALGIGLVFTMPITYLAGAYVLRRLESRAAERPIVRATRPAPQPA